MRTSITSTQMGYVTLTYEDRASGERVVREFMCPRNGGYVREFVNGDWHQVCYGLERLGSTLTCSSPARLLEVIRSEYRRMRMASTI